MKTTSAVIVTTLLAMLGGCEKKGPAELQLPVVEMPPKAEVAPLAASSNAFAFALWRRVGGRPGNLALSPASISTALAMTWGGAKGETAAQMKQTLQLDGEPEVVGRRWGTLASALQSPSRKTKIRIANRLFGEKSYTFEPLFLDRTKAAYGAPLEPVDFKHAVEASRKQINDWVERYTERRIANLLPPRSLGDTTRLVLVNAIYFLGDWAAPFKKEATFDEPFLRSGGARAPVPMMHALGHYGLAKADGVAMLELPYKGEETAMLVVLPDKQDGLAEVEQALDAAKLVAWTGALAGQEVNVTLPKFTIDPPESIPLAEHLSGLGMRDAFDRERADFTGIANPPDPAQRLFISAVFHKAFVKTDEKGTEAAAATAVVMGNVGAAPPPPAAEFKADHPFLFFIVERSSGLILFMGRVADPRP